MAGNLFFTSDEHYGHANILKMSKRAPQLMSPSDLDYFNSAKTDKGEQGTEKFKKLMSKYREEMTHWLVRTHNAVVGPQDRVIHLGDFAYKADGKELREIFKSLNGRHSLIKGNHDSAEVLRLPWVPITDYSPSGSDMAILNDGKDTYVLSHYAYRAWPQMNRGAWHLFGHSHGNLYDDPYTAALDVGIDAEFMNFGPKPVEEIKAVLFARKAALESRFASLEASAAMFGFKVQFMDQNPKFLRVHAGGQLHEYRKFPDVLSAEMWLDGLLAAQTEGFAMV